MANISKNSDMAKSQQGHRRSARIREKDKKSTKTKEPSPSPEAQQKSLLQPKPADRKRKRETGTERGPVKRQKIAHDEESRPKSTESKQEIKLDSIEPKLRKDEQVSILYWIQNEKWPQTLFEADPAKKIEDHISSTYTTTTELTERVEPKHDEEQGFLNSRGSFLADHESGITKADTTMCTKLLKKNCGIPRDTMFEYDGSFNYIRRILPERNESAIAQVIGRLIVPWAEIGIVRGQVGFKCLIDSIKELWDGSVSLDEAVRGQQLDTNGYRMPTPQPDYSVGFLKEAFTKGQIEKLAPFLGGFYKTCSFKGTADMLFPFFTAEVKCSRGSLELADCQNAHSMTRALKGVVDLFRLVNREEELYRRILGFSISHDHDRVRIYGHYPVIDQEKTSYYRHSVRAFSITARNGREKWTSYKFVMALYNNWVPAHFERLSSAVDGLPAGINFDKVSSKSSRSHRSSEVM